MRTRPLLFLLVAVLFMGIGATQALAQAPTLLLRYPAISDQHLVFTYAGDLWIADRNGEDPRRLTVHDGTEGGAYFSPDGRMIAFTGEYDGNNDVFVVGVDGGSPKRLTYHPEADIVRGWTPDGRVLFNTTRDSETRRYGRLFSVSPEGGMPTGEILPRVSRASYSPNGEHIAYTLLPDPFGSWKRYRGGLSPFIWIFDRSSHEVVEVPRKSYTDPVTGSPTYANDTYPVWLGDKVYFLSDRSFIMNVFEYDVASGQVRQLTNHDDYDVKSLKGFGTELVYEQAGRIHVIDTRTGSSSIVDVHINPDLPETRPRFESVSGNIDWYELSPTGQRALFSARGDIWTVPAENGPTRNLTQTSDEHERYALWSPDGGRIAYMSDAGGEYKLHVTDQLGQDEPEVHDLGDANFFFLDSWSLEKDRILYTDNLRSLFYYDLEDRDVVKVAEDPQTHYAFSPVWSADGRYIVFSTYLENDFLAVKVFDTETGRTHQITDGMSHAGSPAISPDNKYIYFTASTDIGLRVQGSEMSSYDRPLTDLLYMAVLQADEPSPFAPESDEEEVASDEDTDDAEDGDDDEAEDEGLPALDFEGIDQRIVALPVEGGNYWTLKVASSGNLFYMSYPEGSDSPKLMTFSLDDEEAEEFLRVNGYELSSNGEKLIYSSRGSYGIVDASGSPSAGDGSLSLSDMEVLVDPRAEWAQMFREAWRLERDFFYDPNMHGADWDAVYEKYEPFVEHLGHRQDLNFLIGELIGELVVGHAYRWGGDMPDVDQVDVGLLGAEYDTDGGRYRFAKIFSGLNWDPDERSPLTEPGVAVQEGEYLIAVNGKEVMARDNLYKFFQNTAGEQTVLLVNDRPRREGAREVTVLPLSSERSLRLRDWVDGNRQKVWEATDGRAAYVYVPNTARAGYTFFTRYYFSQLDKEGVIVDERFNGGGHIADFIVDMLDRPLVSWWTDRSGSYGASPGASIYGPKVMIINENAGSGGDWLPYAFKKRELGTLIGQRTWGGLVGIGGIPGLIDGGAVTVPNFAFFTEDGQWGVENFGVEPDIWVQQEPKAVIAGEDPQLDAAIEVINEQLRDYTPPTPDPEPRPKRATMGR